MEGYSCIKDSIISAGQITVPISQLFIDSHIV